MMIKIFSLLFVVLIFSACSEKEIHIDKKIHYANSFPTAVKVVANELDSAMIAERYTKIVFTSLVDLNNFHESSDFGRLFSESLMTQMSLRGFNVVEYRGDAIFTKNEEGEFRLNRAKVKQVKGENILLLVGTYSKINNILVVNVRVVENQSNELVSAASVYISVKHRVQLIPSDCKQGDYCWRGIND